MNESKLELNWPDDITYDGKTKWESTIIQNKLIAFISFHYDHNPINPCEEWDGFGEIRSFSNRHINSITQEEIESLFEEDPTNKEQIIPLSYFEHGNCKWGVMGTMSNMPDFNWDGVGLAGIWIPDKECIATVDHYEKQAKEKNEEFNRNEKFKELAAQACETYTAYCNGEVYGFMAELYRLQLDEDNNPIEDYDHYESNVDQLFEDSCWGYYGHEDFKHMKETIVDSIAHHIHVMKAESQFNDNGEPDYSKMKQEEFDKLLEEIVGRQSASYLMSIPGMYEVVSEHFNNDVLDEWAKEQLK